MRLILLTALTALACPVGASAAISSAYDAPTRTLTVRSDASDPIVVACAAMQVTVNGLPPTASPVPCFIKQLEVTGGPGANRIDLSRAPMAGDGATRGISARAQIAAGAGDDHVVGPDGSVLTLLDGGPGSDTLEGRSVDTYVFGPAAEPETDTVVEKGEARCEPSFAETDVPNVSWWTIPWDALDFHTLLADDPLTVSLTAPGGMLARHTNRIVLLESGSAQPLDAIAGGAGKDNLSGACLTLGGPGNDILSGSPTGDGIDGGPGDDTLAGQSGPDTLIGGLGNDHLDAGSGPDRLDGGAGDDRLVGGAGDDVYLWSDRRSNETDVADEPWSGGFDVLAFHLPSTVRGRVDLGHLEGGRIAAAGRIVVTAPRASFEGVVGGAGNDTLIGNDRKNAFWGGGGTDLAHGRGGDDVYHVDWHTDLPAGAYASQEFWLGPFPKPVVTGWSPFSPRIRGRLQIAERRYGGRDTLDAGGGWNGAARVDLRGPVLFTSPTLVTAVAAPGARLWLEVVRGTPYDDVIVGNGLPNLIDGRGGRDRIDGAGGVDTCIRSSRDRDVLRGCEHVRRLR